MNNIINLLKEYEFNGIINIKHNKTSKLYINNIINNEKYIKIQYFQ